MRAHALNAAVPVRLQQRVPVGLGIGQEPVGPLRLGPAAAGIGDALHRLAAQPLGQQHRARVQPRIAQIQRLEFFPCPAHSIP